MKNEYIPYKVKILDIIKHTSKEWTFRVERKCGEINPGQFFEISMPKYGESPISVSGYSDEYLDFTIREVGKVTEEIFKLNIGDTLRVRGPYGNGFELKNYIDKEIIIVSGASGLAPVRGILEYFYENIDECKSVTLICGFRSPDDILFKEDIEKWKAKFNVILTVDKGDDNYNGKVGLVTKYVPELSINDKCNVSVVIVGPPMMMKFTIIEFQKIGIQDYNMWVSYERKMCCGLGKCGHCRMNTTYICTDGPVFNYAFGKNLYD